MQSRSRLSKRRACNTPKAADLADFEITPSGYGLHFRKLDADLWLPALLEGAFGSRA